MSVSFEDRMGFADIELPEIALIIHKSPMEMVKRFFCNNEPMTDEEFLESDVGGVDADGNESVCKGVDYMEGLRAAGFFAFADCPKKIIHFWMERPLTDENLLIVLGHEIGHVVEDQEFNENPDIACEERADTYGIAAMMAVRFVQRVRDSEAWACRG